MARYNDKDVHDLFGNLAAACGKRVSNGATGAIGEWRLKAVARGWIIEEFTPSRSHKGPPEERSSCTTEILGSRVRGTSEMMSAMWLALAAVGEAKLQFQPAPPEAR